MNSNKVRQLGEFRVIREIGRGGMGIVYEAEQIRPKRRVALKVLPAGFAPDSRALRLFEREASAAGRLSHPNIVAIHSIGQEGDVHYFVMDYVDGITLAQLIKETKLKDVSTVVATDQAVRHASDTEPVSSEGEDQKADEDDEASTDGLRRDYFNTIVGYIIQAAEGLDHAHRHGIIHRDVKPSNLMLTNEGRVMLMDFGLAKEEDASKHTQTGRPIGTIWYMSPEQINPNALRVDKRTDIYSLGVTLYQLLTLRLPFKHRERERAFNEIMFKDPPRPCSLVPQLPVDIETITLKAIEKDPDRRYQSAQEMADDLRRYLNSEPIWAKPPTLTDRIVKVVKRHRMAACIAAISFIVVVMVVSMSGYLLYRSERRRVQGITQALIRSAEGLMQVKSYEEAYACLGVAVRQAPGNKAIGQLIDSITGSASFSTIPENASVYLSYINAATTEIAEEREFLGVTPCERQGLLAGEYKVDVQKDGYGTLEFLINVKPGRKTEIERTLVGSADLPAGLTLEDGKIICEKDGAEMARIPAGEFLMGIDFPTGNEPSHPVYLDAYYIDKYEVTNEQYGKFLDWIRRTQDHSNCHANEGPGKKHTPRYWSDERLDPRKPVVGVDWYDAYSYAAWAGKALPSEAEWEKAAKGGRRLFSVGVELQTDLERGVLSTALRERFVEHGVSLSDGETVKTREKGSQWQIGAIRIIKSDGVLNVYRAGASFPWGSSKPNTERAIYGLAKPLSDVGTCPAGISPFGCYDMSGNAKEWCGDWHDRAYYRESPFKNPMGPLSGTLRVVRGGGWNTTALCIHCSVRACRHPVVRTSAIGFRCVKR